MSIPTYQIIEATPDSKTGVVLRGAVKEFWKSHEHEIMLVGPAECVSGDTVLTDPITGEEKSIKWYYDNNKHPRVMTLGGMVLADVPFKKGHDILYSIQCDDGSSFSATQKHLILTEDGFCLVANLQIGQFLRGYSQFPLASSWELFPEVSRQDDLHLIEIIPGYQSNYWSDFRLYDGQLLFDPENVQVSSPLPDDVQGRNDDARSLDDRVGKSRYNHPHQFYVPPSSVNSDLHSFEEVYHDNQSHFVVGKLSTYGDLYQYGQLSQLGIGYQQPSEEWHHGSSYSSQLVLPLCKSPLFYYTVQSRRIQEIKEIGEGDYYDLTVPQWHHYFSCGFIHHNTGKTYGGMHKLDALMWKYPGSQAAIVRKFAVTMTGTICQTLEKVANMQAVRILGGTRPERYVYPNGSQIWLGGMDNPNKVLGGERDFIYFNQAEEATVDDWETLLTRATGRAAHAPYAQLMGDCNPAGSRHWIRSRSSLTRFVSVHTDNPTLYDDFGNLTERGKITMATLQNLSGVRRKRLLEGEWATAEGAVYDTFSQSVHVKVRENIEFTRWMLAMDEGYTNPAVILLVGFDGDGRQHIAKEYYRRGVLQSDVVSVALQWNTEYPCEVVAVDAAAAGLIADLRNIGLPAAPYKGRVKDGIDKVASLLKVQGDGKPRLTVDPLCVNVINEFESYVWRPEKDEPVKENDHSMDAIRYLQDATKPVQIFI